MKEHVLDLLLNLAHSHSKCSPVCYKLYQHHIPCFTLCNYKVWVKSSQDFPILLYPNLLLGSRGSKEAFPRSVKIHSNSTCSLFQLENSSLEDSELMSPWTMQEEAESTEKGSTLKFIIWFGVNISFGQHNNLALD